jgi:lipoate-protein ligase A
MIGKSELKVEGGKLIRVECDVHERSYVVMRLIITGDFFLHPEEAIEELEGSLLMVRAEPEILTSRIQNFFAKGYTLVGAKPEDFTHAILNAISNAREGKQ